MAIEGVVMEWVVCRVLGRRLPLPVEVTSPEIKRTVTLREGRLIPWIGGKLGNMRGPASAVTLGRTIVIHPEARLTPSLFTHELVHVRQWRRDPLFPLRYALATLRYGYHDNPYEVEARTLASSDWPTASADERIA